MIGAAQHTYTHTQPCIYSIFFVVLCDLLSSRTHTIRFQLTRSPSHSMLYCIQHCIEYNTLALIMQSERAQRASDFENINAWMSETKWEVGRKNLQQHKKGGDGVEDEERKRVRGTHNMNEYRKRQVESNWIWFDVLVCSQALRTTIENGKIGLQSLFALHLFLSSFKTFAIFRSNVSGRAE